MSFLTSFRSAASHSRVQRSRNFPHTRMSIIEEDHIHTPGISHLPSSSSPSYLEPLSHRNFEIPPPPYILSTPKFGVEDQKVVKPEGWRRFLILSVSLLCLVGLLLGLGLGLSRTRKHRAVNDHPPDSSAPAVPIIPLNESFPSGNYSIDTVLTTVTTNCTSSQATWRCFPYTTYSSGSSEAAAAATFIWTIRADSLGNYTITAFPNAFAPTFASIPLTLVDPDLDTERYIFSLNSTKSVIPSGSISNSDAAATCYYNSTTFQGAMYTRMNKVYPPDTDNTTSTAEDWPYAVQVSEIAGGGADDPICYDNQGKSLGSFVAQDESQDCNCIYSNFGFNV